jgi:ABC-type Fe3+-hydroxamate transport system substrate-binding protein
MIRTFADQTGASVEVNFPPQRIISLVPSQTELLHALGLESEVVGITKFCELPESWYRSKPKVGGTKTLNMNSIDQLRPDLILGNKEENEKQGIEALRKKYPVWLSDVSTLEDALQMIRAIGVLTMKEKESAVLIEEISQRFRRVRIRSGTVLYLIWKKPWMGAGADTFIHAMLEAMGLTNVLRDVSRYPQLTLDEIQQLDPEIILLSSEPYPFNEHHVGELKNALPHASVALVDGRYFSWYGSRLVHAPDYFNSIQRVSLVATSTFIGAPFAND